MKRFLIIGIFLLGHNVQGDSLTVFGFNDFIQVVVANHPIIKQAELFPGFAESELRMARGMLDPKLTASMDVKNFQDKEYYNLINTTLKIPTWFAVDPKITVDRNRGDFISPEESIPEENKNRQISAGISVPLGKGLFIDERRLVIGQAEAFVDIATAEQTKIVNKILLTAIKDYWNWQLAYQEILLLQRSLAIAEELFDRVLIDYGYGEAAVIDTVQAKITYQQRFIDYENMKFDFLQSGLALSVHLWSETQEPLELQEDVIPDTLAFFAMPLGDQDLNELIDWAQFNHPDLQKLSGKRTQLELDRRWARESLKPQVDLSYSFIDAPLTPVGDFRSPSINDNYKFGLDFSFPIYLRKERGKLQLTNLKIQDTDFAISQARLQIKNNILTKQAQIQLSETLTDQYAEMANNYNRLLEAEFLNLDTGESDLFKLNIQQDKYIESQIKYLKTLNKLQKSRAELLYAIGLPYLSLVN